MKIEVIATVHIHNISLLDMLPLKIKNIQNQVHIDRPHFSDLFTLYNFGILSKNTILELYMEKIDKLIFLNIFENTNKIQKETT